MEKPRFCWCLYSLKCFPFLSTTKPKTMEEENRKPGGWKSMPYIIGNESFEKLATIGLLANIMVYLLTQFNMKQVVATNILNIWSGTTNFAPLFGAFLSDAYLGRFTTLALASIASFLGMVTLTFTAILPQLRPPSCKGHHGTCIGPSSSQLGVLFLGLAFLTIGSGGIRPCNLPFGVDQFDPTTQSGRKGINSFFNWYYFTFTAAVMIAMTLIIYIQTNVSWALGLGIPTLLMLCSIVVFFAGTKLYVHVKPSGSVFTGLFQVFVAAFKKRKLTLPPNPQLVLYNPSIKASPIITKLPLTDQLSCLNKAAIQEDGELKPDGSPVSPWRLCGIQQIEEVKCLIRIVPVWAAGIICFTAVVQQSTFTLLQAMKMDRHLGHHFQIPPGSLGLITMVTLTIWVPVYDRIIVPAIRKITKQDGGITLLQRIGIGLAISIMSMVAAGLIEKKRRNWAVSNGMAPISVMWLAPQLVLMGLAEAFNAIGQIEFYYKEFPDHMRSIAGSLLSLTMAGASYLSSFIVTMVHKTTGKHGKPKWLGDDINTCRLEYFYYLIAGLGVLNLCYFLICANSYHYKANSQVVDVDEGAKVDIELNSSISDKNGI